jgi:hypothetical protein
VTKTATAIRLRFARWWAERLCVIEDVDDARPGETAVTVTIRDGADEADARKRVLGYVRARRAFADAVGL